jgi:hypothetical protein
MENVGIFCDHLEYLIAVWNILRLFGIFYGRLEYFMNVRYSLWSFGIFFPFW